MMQPAWSRARPVGAAIDTLAGGKEERGRDRRRQLGGRAKPDESRNPDEPRLLRKPKDAGSGAHEFGTSEKRPHEGLRKADT